MSSEIVFIRNDLLKLLYSGMLLSLSIDEVRSFWKQNPVPGIAGDRHEPDMYRFLWNEKNKAPLEYVFRTMNALQGFLMRKGIFAGDFLKDSIQSINRGSLVGAKTALLLVHPFIEKLFAEKDIRTLALQQFPNLTRVLSPSIVHEMVRFESDGDYNSAWMMMMLTDPPRSFQFYEKIFRGTFPPYDVELWTGMVTQMSPTVLNLPPFEELSTVCDTRTIGEILTDHCPSTFTPLLSDEGMQSISFHEFCRRQGLDLTSYKIPDVTVQTIATDRVCPRMKRTLFYKDCAYGAPVGIYKLRFKKHIEKPKDILSVVFHEALEESGQITTTLQRLHEQILEKATFKARFLYNVKHESLSVNGEHLVKFVPAKILRKILKEYTMTGQQEFTYRDLSYDIEVVNHHKSSNIDVRFNRLSDLLEKEFPHVTLRKKGRGKIVLEASCRIEFAEE